VVGKDWVKHGKYTLGFIPEGVSKHLFVAWACTELEKEGNEAKFLLYEHDPQALVVLYLGTILVEPDD